MAPRTLPGALTVLVPVPTHPSPHSAAARLSLGPANLDRGALRAVRWDGRVDKQTLTIHGNLVRWAGGNRDGPGSGCVPGCGRPATPVLRVSLTVSTRHRPVLDAQFRPLDIRATVDVMTEAYEDVPFSELLHTGHAGQRLRRGVPVMSRSAVRAFAGGIGIVAGLVVRHLRGRAARRPGLPSDSRADDPPPATSSRSRAPTELVIALGLSDPVLQAGVVGEGEVIIARVSRSTSPAISPSASGSPGFASSTSSPLAAARRQSAPLGSLDRLDQARPRASATADLSDPYLGTDQAVVLRRGLPRLATLTRSPQQDHLRRARQRRRAIAGTVAPP